MAQDARSQEESIAQRRAGVLGMNYTDTSKIDKQIFQNILSVAEFYQLKVVPLVADEHFVHFGITSTTSQQTINMLKQRFTDQRLEFSIISEAGYAEYMKLYDPPKQINYQDISLKPDTDSDKIVSEVSATLESVRPDDILAYLVQQAYALKSSDIHIENQKEKVRIRFRVDGVLHPVAFISHEKYRHLSSVIASAANIYSESKEPQTGHISRQYKLATNETVALNLRVETVPTVYGMDAVMRLFNQGLELFSIENLGLSDSELENVQKVIKHPTGMVLIVGPTGSGKTTSLYSLINTLNSPERKIITLEDPVEYNIPGVVQIPVQGKIESQNFADKLRSVLRLDPDVVMVGEIRDPDTAKTALQGALTGHLVLSTFHSDGAAAALTRILDMIGENPLLPSAIKLIMAQRLVRRLDDETKQPYQPDESLKTQLQQAVDSFPEHLQKPDLRDITLYRPGSSEQNPFGYRGQIALREQLVMTPGLQQVLRLSPNQITTQMIQDKAVEEGMRTMLQDGLLKALAGETTIEEVYRVVS